MMAEQALEADRAAIRADLEYMTARWHELPEPAMFELRALGENVQPQTAKFKPEWLDDAVEWAVNLNRLNRNIYVTRNPIRASYTGAATDADIVAAFFLWADCDDITSAENVKRFDGPKWSASVTTGKVPTTRAHAYWSLQEPCYDLAAWRAMQAAIAQHFASDASVINPARIMRLAGTITHPSTQKRARGYIPELATMRTTYKDAREPVTLEQMARVFGDAAPRMTLSQMATPKGPAPSGGASFNIDTGGSLGPSLNREQLAIQALSGTEWHNAVIRLVASYVGKGLSDAEIHALTQPLTLPGYTGEQTAREVQTAIDGARRKGWEPAPAPQPAYGYTAQAAQPAQPETPNAAQDASFDAPAPEPATWPTRYTMFDDSAIPPRQWVYGRHYLRKFVSVLASAGGIGKTSMQIVEALAICTGKPLLGEAVEQQCNVWLVNLEDPMDEMQRRILAAMKHFGITPDEVQGRLFVDAGRDFAIDFAVQTREGITPNKALVDHLIKRIPELNIGAVFIDPFVGAHKVNENDNMAINAVFAEIRKVADETNCAIGLVHHIRKGNGEDANIDSVRGAGSLIGAARAARVINKVSLDAAMAMGINAKDAAGLFRVDDGKANLAPPATKAVYRRMEGVQIGNGEWVGVAAPYKLPDEWEGMDDNTVNEMLCIIDRGIPHESGSEEYYSIRPQDKDRWVGNVILTYPFDNPDHAKNAGQAKRIIQRWDENGLLEAFEYMSEAQRKTRKGVRSRGRVGEQNAR